MLVALSTQPRTKIVNPCLTKQNSNVKSSSSLPKGGHKIIHSETTHLNSRSNRFIIDTQSEEVINAIQILGRRKVLKN